MSEAIQKLSAPVGKAETGAVDHAFSLLPICRVRGKTSSGNKKRTGLVISAYLKRGRKIGGKRDGER